MSGRNNDQGRCVAIVTWGTGLFTSGRHGDKDGGCLYQVTIVTMWEAAFVRWS